MSDMKEIKNILEPSDFALLENEINNHHLRDGGKVKNITYLQQSK